MFDIKYPIRSYPLESFVKHDDNKRQWHLLPVELLEGTVDVLEYGAKKYGKNNWKNCQDVTRYRDALMRHVVAYMSGEYEDPDTRLSHLDHIICNALFLKWFTEGNSGS